MGNFPFVLGQNIDSARAGSSAHNLYLSIASEMGLLALAGTLWFLWKLFRKIYDNFISSQDSFLMVYYGSALLFIPWVLIYLLTDSALFDERAFLMFATVAVIILGKKHD